VLRLFAGPLNSFSICSFCEGRKKSEKANKMCAKITREKRTETLNWLASTTSTHMESQSLKSAFLDSLENQYLIMQLSIRKLLSVCRALAFSLSLTGHSDPCKQDQWIGIPGCCFLIYGSKIIIRFRLQIPNTRNRVKEAKRAILIYGVHMRIALSLAIIKFEGNWFKAERNEIQLQESRSHPHWPNIYIQAHIWFAHNSQFNINRH
jgi:hypothetical protein